MKRTLSFLLAIALTVTMVTPAFAANPNPKAGTGVTNSEKVLVEKTWITFNEKGITISRGNTIFLPYQVSKTNPTITIKNVGGVICLQFLDSLGRLRLISLGKEENLVFNGKFPALTIDKSIKKMNITFAENASIGKFTINGDATVDIHEKMSVSELLINGAATVNFAKNAKIGKAIVTSTKAILNIPAGASFKVKKSFAVRVPTLPGGSSGSGGNQGGGSVTPPERPIIDSATVSTQADVKALDVESTYKIITITGNENLDLSGITAKKVIVEDATKLNAVGRRMMQPTPRNSPPVFTRKLMFPNTVEEIECYARAEIMTDSRLKKFTGNKDGIVLNAPVETLIVRAPLEINRDVGTVNAFADFKMVGTVIDLINVNARITISSNGSSVGNIVTASDLNLLKVYAGKVTTTGESNVRITCGNACIIGNLIAGAVTTTIVPGHRVVTATANGSLTIDATSDPSNNFVQAVVVPAATDKAITITVNGPLRQLVTARSVTIAGIAPVENVIVTGTEAVKLTISNTAETKPVVSAPDGAPLTDKNGTAISTTEKYTAPKLTLTDKDGNILEANKDYTLSSFGNIVINLKNRTDVIYIKPNGEAPTNKNYKCSQDQKYWHDYEITNEFVTVTAKGYNLQLNVANSGKETQYAYFKTVSDGTGGNKKADSQTVSVTANFPPSETFEVTFKTNGGSTIAPIFRYAGDKINPPPTPTKAGATFSGWYKDEAFTDDWDSGNDKVTGAITLYAKWADADTTAPTASFDPVDGEKDVAVDKSISIFFDEPITITGKVADAVTLKNSGNDVPATVTLSADAKRIVIKPTALNLETTYTVAIVANAIKDNAGNSVVGSVKFTAISTKSATPTSDITTVYKKSLKQAAVAFKLTNNPNFNITATWKVYTGDTGATEATDVKASLIDDQLTLTSTTGDMEPKKYYVAVTEKGKEESDRLALTVGDISRTPTTDNPTVTKKTTPQKSVEFTLTNSPQFAKDAVWVVTNIGGAISNYVTAAVSGSKLTLTHASNLDPADYYVAVIEKDKAESDRLMLTVKDNTPGKGNVPVAETLLTLSELKVDDALVDGFSAETLRYSVNLPAGTVEVPQVTAVGLDPKAKVEILQASDLNTSATVTVSAANGKKVYTVNFVVAAPTEDAPAEESADKAAEDKASEAVPDPPADEPATPAT